MGVIQWIIPQKKGWWKKLLLNHCHFSQSQTLKPYNGRRSTHLLPCTHITIKYVHLSTSKKDGKKRSKEWRVNDSHVVIFQIRNRHRICMYNGRSGRSPLHTPTIITVYVYGLCNVFDECFLRVKGIYDVRVLHRQRLLRLNNSHDPSFRSIDSIRSECSSDDDQTYVRRRRYGV